MADEKLTERREWVPDAEWRRQEFARKEKSFAETLQSTSFEKLVKLRVKLIDELQRIRAALTANKFDMLAERTELIADGVDPRGAQVMATAGSNIDWRQRATSALEKTNKKLTRLNARLKELNMAHVPDRTTVRYSGGLDEVERLLQRDLDAGMTVFAMAFVDGVLLAVVAPPRPPAT